MKKGFITNIEKDTLDNNFYRKVLYTGKNIQLVLMSLKPGEEIGEEVHTLDQFIRIEAGEGMLYMSDVENSIGEDMAFVIPEGIKHNVVNTGDVPLKLYSIYSPPEHKDGVIHETKDQAFEEHFDGKTTE